MNKSVNFSSSIQLKTLVPGSLALLLAACGGGQEESPAQTAQLAGYSSSSADMASAGAAAPASPSGHGSHSCHALQAVRVTAGQ